MILINIFKKVGHTFLLGTKYSQTLNALYIAEDGSRLPCQMGCYGIGVSRILAASVEVLATESDIRWPRAIAPYSICAIAPKVKLISLWLPKLKFQRALMLLY